MLFCVTVFNCQHGQAPSYLVELCQPVADVTSSQHLQSATQQLLVVPHHQLSSHGRRAFRVASPSVWNSLPDSLRDPVVGRNSFRRSLKAFPFATYWCIQHSRGFTTKSYINWLFTYLLSVRSLSWFLRVWSGRYSTYRKFKKCLMRKPSIDLLSAELWFSSFDDIFQILLVTWNVYVSLCRTCLHFTEQCPALATSWRSIQLRSDAWYVWIIDKDAVRSKHFGLALSAKPSHHSRHSWCTANLVYAFYNFYW